MVRLVFERTETVGGYAMTYAEQVIALSDALKESRWASTQFRNDLYRFISAELDRQAKRKAVLPAGEVWEMVDGSYLKRPNHKPFSLSNRQQFEGKGEQA